MYLLIIFICGCIIGYCWSYNQGYIDGKRENNDIWTLKYTLAKKQNDVLWKKYEEAMQIIKHNDREVKNCWNKELEWKE